MNFKSFLPLFFCVFLISTQAADWYTWRGPHGNGISDETGWNPQAIATPKIIWQQELGVGYSSVSVINDKLYTMGNLEIDGTSTDVVYCLDAKSGQEIWKYSYSCPRGNYPGPRATPIFENGRIYTLSQMGRLYCFEALTGKVIWQRDILQEYDFPTINWGLASSAVFYEDILIVNAGRAGIAFNKNNGKLIWNNGIGKAGYATPVLFNQQQTTYAAIFSDAALHLVQAATGKIKWTYPWEDRYEVYAFDPLIDNNKLFLTSESPRNGCVLLDINGEKPQEIWSKKRLKVIFGGNVLMNGFMYGVDGTPGSTAKLKCFHYETGEEKWSQALGFGTFNVAANKILFLHENGTLYVIEVNPNRYREIAKGKILEKKVCWTAPILANGRIYARNNPGQLVCIDMSQ